MRGGIADRAWWADGRPWRSFYRLPGQMVEVDVSSSDADAHARARYGVRALEHARERNRAGWLDDDLHPFPDDAHCAHDGLLAAGRDVVDVRTDRAERARRERRAQTIGDRRRRRQRLDVAGTEAGRRVSRIGGLGAI